MGAANSQVKRIANRQINRWGECLQTHTIFDGRMPAIDARCSR
jgi:hypothetical protein